MRWSHQHQRLVGLLSLPIMTLATSASWGQCLRSEITLDQPQGEDRFGAALAVAGDALFASAPGHHLGDANGVVVWFERTGQWEWQSRGLIRPDDPEAHVGQALATGAGVLVIGSYQSSTVHIFAPEADGWVETQTLEPLDAVDNSRFGQGVALSEQVLVVGSPNDQGLLGGAVYIYELAPSNRWELQLKYAPNEHDRLLGRRVATDGETVIATGGSALHLLERDGRSGWQPTTRLFPQQMYSYSPLTVAGDEVFIGAEGYDGDDANQGAVHHYRRDSSGDWQAAPSLTLPDPQQDEALGSALCLHGDLLFAIAAGNGSYLRPTVHLFERAADAWSYAGRGDSGYAPDDYGYALAAARDALIVSAPLDGDFDSGVVQVHAYSGDADGDALLDACYLPGDLNLDGIVDEADVQLVVDNYGLLCPANQCLPTELEIPIDIYEGFGFDVAVLGESVFVHERGDVSRHDRYMRVHRFEQSGEDWDYEETFGIYNWGWRMDASDSFVAVGGVGGDVHVIQQAGGVWADVQIAPSNDDELHFVIAATGDTIASFYDESVRIYERDDLGQWSEKQDFEIGVGLGWSEMGAGDGDVIGAAAYGEVVILERGSDDLWELAQVVPLDFGELRDIAVDGERILVGAPPRPYEPAQRGRCLSHRKDEGRRLGPDAAHRVGREHGQHSLRAVGGDARQHCSHQCALCAPERIQSSRRRASL